MAQQQVTESFAVGAGRPRGLPGSRLRGYRVTAATGLWATLRRNTGHPGESQPPLGLHEVWGRGLWGENEIPVFEK